MAEYSRLASGQVVSTGGATAVIVPFIPNFIEISNSTRAVAATGVTRAWWETDMGQGAAFVETTSAGPATGTSFISSTTGGGFTTVQAGLALQYGPLQFLGGSGSITKASPAVVTTTAAHGLVSGNVVIFQNLYETSSTGMQQIAGIPFVVTVTSPTSFTIPWNTNQSNYTAITAGGLNANASFKQVLYPALYAPGDSFVSSITTTLGVVTVTTTDPHNFKIGQEIAFRIPSNWGSVELNSLPDVFIPGSPLYFYVSTVPTSTSFTLVSNPTYTAFNSNQPFSNFNEQQFAQVVAVGDINTGSGLNAFGPLYPSPTVFNGYSTVAVNTINGPAIAGAYINATFQGFIIGASVSGTVADVIYWRAYMHDVNF
jgi:hypothetical protein